ncbi:hypothetical protein CLOSTMETH_02299 [[Clostridium] methylpentosum DSM 5476]|uniref:Uncharacterized protein n=1 Tax=[Clostridium] methylpentosum DSM 5476 TaxID=537013 RepID=C0EEL3_9FIRM|nr:hypothetical protein CLOSTMETH_02299 [[Clostridium] methylpentosum DSM 5476]
MLADHENQKTLTHSTPEKLSTVNPVPKHPPQLPRPFFIEYDSRNEWGILSQKKKQSKCPPPFC